MARRVPGGRPPTLSPALTPGPIGAAGAALISSTSGFGNGGYYARTDPLDANSRRQGRSGSLGQVSGRWKSLAAARGR